ncbi:hypothetical protein CFN16_06010 [Pseudomonas fluorescens]|uniref:Uncharacterized protein n=1 Tax=Pseudomonas fluorescens TaxID=294 RepID=A0A345UTA0_PSEFL|nr:hypothetical protein [Pseudomonas fluorescens]AXJ03702.1 hypothetical protein CFN16_06010 [Pseudomonas fluorescens]WJK11243.1 hypothetical protein QR290_07850 [Pseudomonas fluorescens]
MDEIEEYLSQFTGKESPEDIERERVYLSGLSKERFEEIRAQNAFERTYESNYAQAMQQQPAQWVNLRNKTSGTYVLFQIFNRTRETFSLTSSSWANDPDRYEIPPAGYVIFTLPGNLLKRISSANAGYRSSQINHQFTYSSGNYAFNFSTAAKLTLKYEPFAFGDTTSVSRSHSIRSIGQSEIVCEYMMEQNQNKSPYSYAITIQIS